MFTHPYPIRFAGVIWDAMVENMARQGFCGEIDQYLAHLVRRDFERLPPPHNVEYHSEIVRFNFVRGAGLPHEDDQGHTSTAVPFAGVIWGMLRENMRRGIYFKNEIAAYLADQVRRDAVTGYGTGPLPSKNPQLKAGWTN